MCACKQNFEFVYKSLIGRARKSTMLSIISKRVWHLPKLFKFIFAH